MFGIERSHFVKRIWTLLPLYDSKDMIDIVLSGKHKWTTGNNSKSNNKTLVVRFEQRNDYNMRARKILEIVVY